MKIYVTRHGQVLPTKFYKNVQFPAGDMPITELGHMQAKRLGEYMKHIGFTGKIYSSPYIRTLETAEIIADCTGSEIIPWAPMREIVNCVENILPFNGLTLDEIRTRFRHISEECTLSYPWWTVDYETEEDVFTRLKKGFEALDLKEDAMFVGHGASLEGLIEVLGIPHTGGLPYNCCFSMYDTENKKNFKYMDDAHLPYKLRTFNSVLKYEEDAKVIENILNQGIEIPDEIKTTNSAKLLHIGDTKAYTYPYYKKLIEEVKPDIIIHTGDFVDEVKAGRMINTREEYEDGVKIIADILKNSGAREIYLVCGNNDIPSVIAEYMPFAKIVEPDTVVDICGVSCNLGHGHYEATMHTEWSFYGHGLSGETWSPDKNNIKSGICRFNVIWGASVILIPDREQFVFPRPETYKRLI